MDKPKWITGSLICGGGLLSAFSGKLPEAVQNLGLWVGIILCGVGVLGWLLYFVKMQYVKNKSEGRFLFCIFIVLILGVGVWIYSFSKNTKHDEATNSLEISQNNQQRRFRAIIIGNTMSNAETVLKMDDPQQSGTVDFESNNITDVGTVFDFSNDRNKNKKEEGK